MKKFGIFSASLVAGVWFGAGLVTAATVEYESRAAFDDAAGPTTTINFNQYTGVIDHNTSLTIGDVTFTQPQGEMFTLGAGVYSDISWGSTYLNQNNPSTGATSIAAQFGTPVYSVGMDLGNIFDNGSSLYTNTFMTLHNGGVLIDQVDFSPAPIEGTGNPFSFFGIVSHAAFDSITFYNPSESGISIDNFSYSSVQPVPEVTTTGSLAAIASLLALMAFLWERRRIEVPAV